MGLMLLAGCRGRGIEGDQLIIITPHWQGVVDEFTAAFEGYYLEKTGRPITLEWLDQGGTADDLRYVQSEFERSPKGIGIDLFTAAESMRLKCCMRAASWFRSSSLMRCLRRSLRSCSACRCTRRAITGTGQRSVDLE